MKETRAGATKANCTSWELYGNGNPLAFMDKDRSDWILVLAKWKTHERHNQKNWESFAFQL